MALNLQSEPAKQPDPKAGFFDKVLPNVKAALITIAVTVTLAVLGGVYTIGYNLGAKDLETVNDFRKLELPKITSDLGVLAKDLHERAQLVTENQRLAKEVADQKAENKRVGQDIDQQRKTISDLQNRIATQDAMIAKIMPTDVLTVSIKQGDAQRVIPNALTIGVVTLYSSWVDTRINGSSTNMEVGENKEVRVSDQLCRVELIKLDNAHAEFTVTCSKK